MPSTTKRGRERGGKNHAVAVRDTIFIIIIIIIIIIITGEIRTVYSTQWFQTMPVRPSVNYRLETRNHGEVKKVA